MTISISIPPTARYQAKLDTFLGDMLLNYNAAHLEACAGILERCAQCGWPVDGSRKICELCVLLFDNVHERMWFLLAQKDWLDQMKEWARMKQRIMGT